MSEALAALFQKYEYQGAGLPPDALNEMEKSFKIFTTEFGVPPEDHGRQQWAGK